MWQTTPEKLEKIHQRANCLITLLTTLQEDYNKNAFRVTLQQKPERYSYKTKLCKSHVLPCIIELTRSCTFLIETLADMKASPQMNDYGSCLKSLLEIKHEMQVAMIDFDSLFYWRPSSKYGMSLMPARIVKEAGDSKQLAESQTIAHKTIYSICKIVKLDGELGMGEGSRVLP